MSAPLSDAPATTFVLEFLESDALGEYCILAVVCLIFYDYALTFTSEVELIWGRRLTSVTLLFHLNRWITFAWTACGLLTLDPAGPTHAFSFFMRLPACIGLNILAGSVSLILKSVWAVFSAVRIYAISGGSWRLSYVVYLLGMVPVGTGVYGSFIATSYSVSNIPVIGMTCVENIKDNEAETVICELCNYYHLQC
ncbi:hypothetical protein OBBRIDRAFT_834254 [Obba rivulosa]|uniref:DUF6533 domain-containing protein n=1 Tax=Obba rivulosa TaxID=1052685 RepID=A0A8E2AW06_9APHY|nr:hypothetical protein OBBRIDRAFT_834254 [Obba rivulosa]